METRKCPEHRGTGLTPTDFECHSHSSNTQQGFHNLHCRVIGCPHALSGSERHPDEPIIKPRNTMEIFLARLDRKSKK